MANRKLSRAFQQAIDGVHMLPLSPERVPQKRVIVTAAVYRRFLEFLHVGIQSTGCILSRPWSQQLNDIMSVIECAQLHS